MTAEEEAHLEFYRRWHRLAAPYFQWQIEQFGDCFGNRVADIGCGPGNLTSQLLDRELYLGIDHDPAMLRELELEYASRGNIETEEMDAMDPNLSATLRRHAVDTILCCNLIEHIEADDIVLRQLCNALPRNGVLALLVPAMPSIFGTLDSLDNHYRRYTPDLVRQRLFELPVRVERLRYFNMIGALGWWWKGRVLKAPVQDDENYRLMNIAIPFVRPLEKLIPPPFGLSLVAIARKTA